MEKERAEEICKEFASTHKLIFEEEGECGFGRECVGFLSRGGNWLAHNPYDTGEYEPIEEFANDDLYAPDDVDSYHKHDCLAVLGRGEEAIIGLAQWVEKINALGNVRVEEFRTGATGMQAMVSGVTDFCVMADVA